MPTPLPTACRSGSPLDPQCSAENVRLAEDAKFYVIVDAATLLRHADLIEHASVTNVIVPGLVFHAVRSGNTSVFLRLKEMLRSSTKHFYFFSNEHCKVSSPSRCQIAAHAPSGYLLTKCSSPFKSRGVLS